jgi:tyrosyl-tRNA synthetase
MINTGFFAELRARGIAYQYTPEIEKQLEKQTTFYLGIDPTGDALHIGHYFGITIMRRAYEAGHKIILLAGGGTAQIGDPGGKNAERPILSKEVIHANKEKIKKEMARLIGLDPKDFTMVDNADWLGNLHLLDFLREAGKYIGLSSMLDKETVQTGLKRETGISYAEFSYQLLQAYDYLKLFEKYDCRVQLGGSDQWGNIIQGVELIRKVRGETAHALSNPLIVDPKTGKKFGKTESGAGIWLDRTKTHPYHLYQFLVNTGDELAQLLLKFYSFKSLDEIAEIEKGWIREERTLQKALALELLTTIHGAADAAAAERVTRLLFGGRLTELTHDDIVFIAQALPHMELPAGTSLTLEEMAIGTSLVASKGEARRLIAQNGLRQHVLSDGSLLIQKGKREYGVVVKSV